MSIVKEITSFPSGKSLGYIFWNGSTYGFFHVASETESTGFADFDQCEDAWHCFNDDWFGN